MKYHHFALAALLMGTGWSTNVVYEVQTGKNLWRGLASESEEEVKPLALADIPTLIERMDERAIKIVVLNKEINEKIKERDLKSLIKIRDQQLPKLKELISIHEKDHESFKTFMDNQIEKQEEELILEDIKRISGIVTRVEEIKADVLMGKTAESIKEALEDKALAQSEAIDDLNQNICRQNRELSSLTTKIDDLIKKQEQVFAEVEKEEKKKEVVKEGKEEQQVLALDPSIFMQALASQFQMPAQSFFEMPQYTGHANQENPFGIDMNFLMMTKMLTESSGFGPRASINYAPVYDQQRTYNGMPSFFNEQHMPMQGNNGFSFANPNQQNLDQNGLPSQGVLFPGFSFARGNGNAGEIPLAQ